MMIDISPEGLSKILEKQVTQVECDDATKLEQSDVSVIKVVIDGGDKDTATSTPPPPLKLLLKNVDVLDQKARIKKTEEKWRISVQSFENEYNFYRQQESDQLKEKGVIIPKCLAMADQRSADGKVEKTALLLEYFSPEQYHQHQDLTFDQAKTALTTLARFHAFHWRETDAGGDKGLFTRGGWWRAELRPSVKFHTIVESFQSLCKNFVEEFQDIDTEESLALMQKLQDNVDEIGVRIRRKGDRTLMHGDCKTSNLFFTLSDDVTALIDFQWTGAASSGGADVAYLLWSGVEYDGISREEELLAHYYAVLREAMPSEYVYTREEFDEDYAIEFLDLFKTCLSQLLNGIDREYCRVNRGLFGWLTHEYHENVMRAFVGKALHLLKSF